MLRVLDYSRVSRHLLATAGDDGSVHLWDTTGRSPKVCTVMTFVPRGIHDIINASLILFSETFWVALNLF